MKPIGLLGAAVLRAVNDWLNENGMQAKVNFTYRKSDKMVFGLPNITVGDDVVIRLEDNRLIAWHVTHNNPCSESLYSSDLTDPNMCQGLLEAIQCEKSRRKP